MQDKRMKKIDCYRVTQQVLGEGNFAKVYLAYAPNHCQLAVKVIPRDKIKQDEINTFQSEITVLRNLKNDYIVNCIDIKKSQTNFYIFLQYCEGGSLAEQIKKRKRIPEKEAMKFFGQILKGMQAMKKMNIIHRDLKPANIMLKEGQIKIVDFGLARKYSKGQMLKTFAGSPFNMAPEVLKLQAYNQKADIYSAGTILYEMLFGVCPFKGKDHQHLIQQIQNKKFKQNSSVFIPSELRNLLKAMLQSNPNDRADLTKVLELFKIYQHSKTEQRINQYKRLSLHSTNFFGVFGALISSLGIVEKIPCKFSQMDLRLYGKLCRKLSPQAVIAA